MAIYYLYVKTHNKTGLKYLGQTKQDPFKYRGSGKRWLNHIKKHGYDVDTEILLETSNKEELKETGIYYSDLWNIVYSDKWANIVTERANGGDTISNHPNREQICLNASKFAKERNAKLISDGLHPFITNNPTPQRVKDGTHNFLGGEVQRAANLKLVSEGRHPFQDKEAAKRRIDKLMAEGRHSCQLTHTCPHCDKTGSGNSMKRWHFANCKKAPPKWGFNSTKLI